MRKQEEILAMRSLVKQHDIDHDLALAIQITLDWVLNETAETPISLLPEGEC